MREREREREHSSWIVSSLINLSSVVTKAWKEDCFKLNLPCQDMTVY